MPPAAMRFAIVAPLLFTASACAQTGTRAVPSRPASSPADTAPAPAPARERSLPTVTLNKIEYISLPNAAKWMRMKTAWQEKERRLTIFDATNKAELEADSRELKLNGLRLFLGRPTLLRNDVLYAAKSDFDRMLLSRLRPELVPAPPPRPRVIALDPGHGGLDNGMENKALGLKEKVLTLDVAQRLQKILVARGYKVVLTRTDDGSLARDKPTDWRMRFDLANRAGADVLISIHFNSLYPDTKTSGTETYMFTPQMNRSDRAWSPKQVDDTERDAMPVNRYDAWSALLSQMMHRNVINQLKTLDRGQKTMHSAVLRGLNCPAVLVESVFLSNESEATRAATAAYRQQIAEALASGIDAYADAVAALHPKPSAPGAVSTPPPK